MNEKESNTPISCLLCQAKIAPNYFDLEDCQELIRELAITLEEMNEYEWRKYVSVS
jgi:hypothetical protein